MTPAVEWPAGLADVRAEIEASLARVGATVVRAEVRRFSAGSVYFVEWVEPGGATEDWYERSPGELAFQIAAQCADAARGRLVHVPHPPVPAELAALGDAHTYSDAACVECHPHPEHGGPCLARDPAEKKPR